MLTKEKCGKVFDKWLWARCYKIYKDLNNYGDHFTVICGKEGRGKSTLLTQMCAVISTDLFHSKHICYKMKQFTGGLKECQKGDSFQLDEGNLFLFSREAMSGDNKAAVKLFSVIRMKNLHIGICVPNFYTLDTYIRDHRVDTLIRISDRGKYTAYVGEGIKIVSKEGAPYKNMNGIRLPLKWMTKGWYTKEIPQINDLSTDEYNKHKEKNIDNFIDELDQVARKTESGKWISANQLAKAKGIDPRTAIKHIKNGNIKGHILGNRYFINENIEDM